MAYKRFSEYTPQENRNGIIGTIVFICMIAGCVKCMSDNPTPSPPRTNDKIDALVNSETFVKERLKAPATADFCNITECDIEQTGIDTFVIKKAFVDAQNSFGANIRTYYTCRIIFKEDNKVICQGLKLLDPN